MGRFLTSRAAGRRLVPGVLIAASLIAATSVFGAERRTLGNGMPVVLHEDASADVAAVELFIRIGQQHAPRDALGLRAVLQRMLALAAKQRINDARYAPLLEARDAAEMMSELAGAILGRATEPGTSLGRILATGTDWEFMDLHSTVNADLLPLACEFLTTMLVRETLTDELREQAVADVRAEADRRAENPAQSIVENTYALLQAAMTGDWRMAAPPPQQVAGLEDITLADLQRFRSRYYVGANVCAAIVSPLSPDDALAAAGALEQIPAGSPAAPAELPPARFKERVKVSSSTLTGLLGGGASMMIGTPAPSLQDPALFAAEVAQAVLGRPSGRLKRDKGLARSLISPQADADDAAVECLLVESGATSSRLVVHAFANPLRVESVRQKIVAHLQALADTPLRKDELDRAKTYILNVYARMHSSKRDTAWLLARYEAFGLSVDFDESFPARIQAVTAEDVQAMAKAYFDGPCVGVQMPELPVDEGEEGDEGMAGGGPSLPPGRSGIPEPEQPVVHRVGHVHAAVVSGGDADGGLQP